MATSLYFQCLLGMACKDFAMLIADRTSLQSIIVVENETDKLYSLSEGIVMGVNGETGDILQFIHFIKQNLLLYRMRNLYPLGTEAAVHFTRKCLADNMRTGTPMVLNLLMGGYDKSKGGLVYTLDFMASCVQAPHITHGFGGMLCGGILQDYHDSKLSERQAYEVMKLCVREIQKRLFVNLPNFQVKVINKDGISSLPDITTDVVKEISFA